MKANQRRCGRLLPGPTGRHLGANWGALGGQLGATWGGPGGTGQLHALVFQGRQVRRSLPSVRPGNLDAPNRLGPVAPGLHALRQIGEILVQVEGVGLCRQPVHTAGGFPVVDRAPARASSTSAARHSPLQSGYASGGDCGPKPVLLFRAASLGGELGQGVWLVFARILRVRHGFPVRAG